MNQSSSKAISVEEAQKTILESVSAVRTESIPLQNAFGRVMAKDTVAREDVPPFDNSSMDGFAIHVSDIAGPLPATLSFGGEVAAGSLLKTELRPKTAIRVMTGAPIPKGANAVVEQEIVQTQNGSVKIDQLVQEGRNIRRRGEDIRVGGVVVRKGTYLKPAHIGVLASLGFSKIEVFKKPRVSFLATGNELANPRKVLSPGKIRNSNSYSVRGLISETGCIPHDLGVSRDVETSLSTKARKGLRCDALVTSGGVSVGKYDLVLSVLEKIGVERKFWKVNIKPGGPFAFGVFHRKSTSVPVFCLPGNTVSSIVTFLKFVRPALQKMMGYSEMPEPIRLNARLEHEIHKKDGKRHFVRGIVRNERGLLFVRSTGTQSSGVLTSLTSANCLIVLPESVTDFAVGQNVEIELL